MPNIVRIKRRVTGAAGAPASLMTAELAYNMADDTIYAGFGDNGSGVATSVKPVGGEGAFAKTASPALTGTPTAPTAAVDTNTTQLATTAFVIAQASSTTPVMNGTAAVGTSTRFARADHVHASDTSRAPLASPTFTGTPAAPTAAVDTSTTQLATTAFVLGQASSTAGAALGTAAVGTSLRYARADHVHAMPTFNQIGAATADVSLGSFKLTNVADPTNAQDAATKAYVDATKQGLDVKDSVRAASTVNITLSTPGATIDGVTMASGDRVLVKDQSAGAQNGIYVWNGAAAAMTRATDANTSAKVTSGMFVFVEEGAVNADSGWVLTTDGSITIDTTALSFTQFSGAGQITAGAGLTKSGNTLNVGAGTGITVNADDVALATSNVLSLFNLATNGIVSRTAANTVTARTITGTANRVTLTNGDGVAGNPTIDIASTYVGQNTITTLGTITTGVWNGTTIAVANGGTGATTLTGLVKGNGTSAFTAAVAGTDYHDTNSTIDGGTF